jgi:Flp pilus assembly protein TadD
MTSNNGFKLVLLLAVAISVTGCASAPQAPKAATLDDLRSTRTDLKYATEFPVTDKTDAMLFFYVRALQFDSQDADLLAEIGKIHHAQNRPEMAVRAFSMALHIEPDNLASLEGRGLIYLANDRNALAEADLRHAVSIAADSWRAHNGLGILANRRGEHLLAAVHYDAALEIVPESAIVLNNRGYSNFSVPFTRVKAGMFRPSICIGKC